MANLGGFIFLPDVILSYTMLCHVILFLPDVVLWYSTLFHTRRYYTLFFSYPTLFYAIALKIIRLGENRKVPYWRTKEYLTQRWWLRSCFIYVILYSIYPFTFSFTRAVVYYTSEYVYINIYFFVVYCWFTHFLHACINLFVVIPYSICPFLLTPMY